MAKRNSTGMTAQLQSGVDSARKQLQAAVEESGRRIDEIKTKAVEIRHKAAEAALQWVLAHDDRIAAVRKSVRDTPIEKAFDALLKLLRSEARPARKAPARKRAAKRRPRKKA